MQPNESYQIETLDNFRALPRARDSRVDSQTIFSILLFAGSILLRRRFPKSSAGGRGSRQTSVQTNLALVGNVKLALETSWEFRAAAFFSS